MPRRKGYVQTPLAERFASKVEVLPDGCWRWTGFTDKAGYGRLKMGGRSEPVGYAHRIAYQLHIGPIPEGAELDHLCRNRWCCNPEHLEAVSHRVNVQRGESPTVVAQRTGRCRRGHEVNETNTYFRKSTGAVVYCRVCRREKRRRACND